MWIGLTGHYRLSYEDKALEAEERLQKLLTQLEKREETLTAAKVKCADEAISLRGNKEGKARCRAKVLECRRINMQIQRLQGYRDTVASHLDALSNTELNQSLITTLEESSKTLKSLGIKDGVKQAETIITGVNESLASIHELTKHLGTPMTLNNIETDEELEQELDILMGIDEPSHPSPLTMPAPQTQQSMHNIAEENEEYPFITAQTSVPAKD